MSLGANPSASLRYSLTRVSAIRSIPSLAVTVDTATRSPTVARRGTRHAASQPGHDAAPVRPRRTLDRSGAPVAADPVGRPVAVDPVVHRVAALPAVVAAGSRRSSRWWRRSRPRWLPVVAAASAALRARADPVAATRVAARRVRWSRRRSGATWPQERAAKRQELDRCGRPHRRRPRPEGQRRDRTPDPWFLIGGLRRQDRRRLRIARRGAVPPR